MDITRNRGQFCLILLFLVLLCVPVRGEILKPTEKQVEVFKRIIEPYMRESWRDKKITEDGYYLEQKIEEIVLNRVDTVKGKELYIVGMIFHVRFYDWKQTKYDEAQMLQNIMFVLSGEVIVGWQPMARIRMKTFPVMNEFRI